jgi:hypothetical protein
MNLLSIIKALRIGSSLPNPTPFKWAGIFSGVALIILQVAQQYGFLTGVSADDWLQLAMLLLVLYSQIATTNKVGILPAAPAAAPVVQPESLPTNTVQYQRPDGFPDGPFFDNDR